MRRFALRALLTAVVTFVAAALPARAQGTSDQFPEPMASVDMEAALDRMGLTGDARTEALKAFEEYVQQLLDLRKGDIDEYLKARPAPGTNLTREEIVARVDKRRQLLRRSAGVEQALFDRIQGVAGEQRQTAVERERMRAERRRDWSTSNPVFGRNSRTELADIVVTATEKDPLTPAQRESVDAALLAIERQETSLLRKLSELAVEEPVAIFDARATSPAQPPANPEDWRSVFEARNKAVKAARAPQLEVRQKLRKAMRDGERQVEGILPAASRSSMHQAFLAKAYPQAANPRDPVPGFVADARKQSEAGELTKDELASIEALAAAHRERRSELDVRLMDALDEEAGSGDSGFGFFVFGSSEDEEKSPSEKLLAERNKLDEETCAAIGAAAPSMQAAVAKPPQGHGTKAVTDGVPIDIGEFAPAEGGVMVMSVSVGDGGDMGAAFVSVVEGEAFDVNATGTPTPLKREELEGLRSRFHLSDEEFSILTLLYEDYTGRWKEIEQSEVAELHELPSGFPGPHGEGTPQTMQTIARRFELRRDITERMLALDNEFFDGVGAALSTRIDKANTERLRRERQRAAWLSADRGAGGFIGAGMMGESKASGADLVRLVRESKLSDGARSTIAPKLNEWDMASVDVYRQRYEIRVAAQKKQAEFDLKMAQTTSDDNGQTAEIRITSETPGLEDMKANGRKVEEADELTARMNEATIRSMLDALNGNAEQVLLEDAWDRAAWPSVFRDRSDVEPKITTALGLADLSPETKSALEAIAAEHRDEYRRISKEMIAANEKAAKENAERRKANTQGDGPDIDIRSMQARQDTMNRLRFERSELNEKTLRRVKEKLTPEQAEKVGDLPKRGERRGIQIGQ